MAYRVAVFALGIFTVVLAYNYFAADMVDVAATVAAAAPAPAPGAARVLLAERYITSALYVY